MDKSTKQGLAAWLVCVGILFGVIAYGSGAMSITPPSGPGATNNSSRYIASQDNTAAAPSFELGGHSGSGFYWDTSSGLPTFSSSGTARWQYGSGAIIPFTNGGLSLGLSGTRWSTVFSGLFTSGVSSGNNGFAIENNGARVDFGAGATDYASSDGTTVTYAGPLASAGSISGTSLTATSASGVTATLYVAPSASAFRGLGQIASSGSAVGADIGSFSNLTTAGDKLARFVNNNGGTIPAYIDISGTYSNAATIGTAASGTGITANYSGWSRQFVHKVTVINTALAAAATSDVTIATTPVNTRITRLTADVTQVFTGGALSAMTVTCGNAAGGNQYLLSGSVFTATTTLGDIQAEIGAGLLSATLADMGTVSAGVPGAITISCRFTCTGANCNAATQGSVAFLVEGTTY